MVTTLRTLRKQPPADVYSTILLRVIVLATAGVMFLDSKRGSISLQMNGTQATLKNCDFAHIASSYAIMNVCTPPLIGHCGIMLENTTYPFTSGPAHLSVWNESEVYTDGFESIMRHFYNPEADDIEGEPQELNEAANSTLNFLTASDGAQLMAVCFAVLNTYVLSSQQRFLIQTTAGHT